MFPGPHHPDRRGRGGARDGLVGLAALLDGLLGGLANLAPARAAAVRAALAIDTGGDEAAEPFAIALATRDLLVAGSGAGPGRGGRRRPALDRRPDAPLTLAYIARRLQFERVAIISARRAGSDADSDTGPTYVLDAVDDVVADRILVDAGVDSADVRRQLIASRYRWCSSRRRT